MVYRLDLEHTDVRGILERGSALSRAWLGLRAGISLGLNPKDTEQVFVLAAALDRDSLPRLRSRMSKSDEGKRLLAEMPSIDTRHVDFARLRALPADTLGGAYVRMLDANKLDPDFFVAPRFVVEPELRYVAQRVRQTHDLWHVLTGLRTDIPGEVALQAFTYAQLRQRWSRAIAIFGVLFYGLRYPNMLKQARHFYGAGKNLPFLLAVRWEQWWAEPLESVRARLGLRQLA